jgi:hypothetical protein
MPFLRDGWRSGRLPAIESPDVRACPLYLCSPPGPISPNLWSHLERLFEVMLGSARREPTKMLAHARCTFPHARSDKRPQLRSSGSAETLKRAKSPASSHTGPSAPQSARPVPRGIPVAW